MYTVKQEFYKCVCHSTHHGILFNIEEYIDKKDNKKFHTSLYLEVQLTQWRKWYKRVWVAIKYIFNIEPDCGHWDAWELHDDDINRLFEMVKYVKEQKELKENNSLRKTND